MKKQYATILSFNVKVNPEAEELARELGVKVIAKEIIYHLDVEYLKHAEWCREQEQIAYGRDANFPVVLEQVAHIVCGGGIKKPKPLIIGVKVLKGQLRVGQRLCVFREPKEEGEEPKIIHLGEVKQMQHNKQKLTQPQRIGTGDIAIQFELNVNLTKNVIAGRHFFLREQLFSFQDRKSIDRLKELYLKDLTREDKILLKKLVYMFRC
jgi:translation initiation factor 5B